MNINNIGILLINSINKNSPENKTKFLKEVNSFNATKSKEAAKLMSDLNYYVTNYENKRDSSNSLYTEYIQKRFALYKKWIDSKKKVDLENLFKLKQPEFNVIPEIYTKKRPQVFFK